VASIQLLGNQPNPFERQTTIALALPEPAPVTLEVIDPAGRRVALLHQGPLSAGEHHFTWNGFRGDGRSAGSGVYFARVRAGERVDAIRMLRLQ
jgi:flagellar hook assembly protein FlgD